VRVARDYSGAVSLTFRPEIPSCTSCGSPLRRSHNAWRKYILAMNGTYRVTNYAFKCSNPRCEHRNVVYKSGEAEFMTPKYRNFGLDVIVEIGYLRFREKRTIDEIRLALARRGVEISRTEVYVLIEVYLELVHSRPLPDEEFLKAAESNGGIVLVVDGVQPEKGNETLYLMMDALTGKMLYATTVLSANAETVAGMIEEVKKLGLSIIAVVSDHQASIRLGVKKALPGVPHQFCHFHYLKNAFKPLSDLDSNLKVGLKRKVRGVRRVEDEAKKLSGREKEVILDFCALLRRLLLITGKYPTGLGGVKVFEGMKVLSKTLESCVKKREHPLLLKLLGMSKAWEGFEPQYKKVRSLLELQNKVREILSSENTISAKVRLGMLVSKAKRMSMKEKDPETKECLNTFVKITRSHWGGLFYCIDDERIPRTNVTIEVKISRMKRGYRRISGRNCWHGYLVRFGSSLAMLEESWTRERMLNMIKRIPYGDYRRTRSGSEEKRERFRRLGRAGKKFLGMLSSAEGKWI